MKLLERIKRALKTGKVEYWSDRPENHPREAFDAVFERDPDLSGLQMKDRESGDGVHGLDGEDHVYAGTIRIEIMNVVKAYYLKFFFWKKDEPRGEQGIEVQSFKDSQ